MIKTIFLNIICTTIEKKLTITEFFKLLFRIGVEDLMFSEIFFIILQSL